MTLTKNKIRKALTTLILLIIGSAINFTISKTGLIPKKTDIIQIVSTYPSIQTSYPISRKAYNLVYNGSTRVAYWVYEGLSKEDLEKNYSRNGMNFKQEPTLPKIVRSTLKDYKYSGFDRGHLCPASDRTYDHETLKETFYLSNILPQLPQFNRGYWNYLEIFVRVLTDVYDKIHVFSIPLYLPHQKGDKKYVHYQVIGENNVAVPTHFAKVIFTENDTFAFILPHENIDLETSLENFRVNLETIEKASGFIFAVQKSKIEQESNKKNIEAYYEKAKTIYLEKIKTYHKGKSNNL